jgi:hypothetical protein
VTRAFDSAGRKRIAQLISKFNRFNLAARRYGGIGFGRVRRSAAREGEKAATGSGTSTAGPVPGAAARTGQLLLLDSAGVECYGLRRGRKACCAPDLAG